MDILGHLGTGFTAAASFQSLAFCLIGVFLGTLIGVLPGVGAISALALLLPVTFGMDSISALIMLAGLYYGAQYGGSITSILINMPGETSSVVTCIEGHQMARRGRAGAALAVAALGSFFAGCVGTLFIAALGPLLSKVALQFNSPDYFSLLVLGLVMAVVLAYGSVLKAFAMVLIGVLLGFVGTDVNSGLTRYTLGIGGLWDGIDILPLVLGLFGIVEIIRNLENPPSERVKVSTRLRDLWPSREEFRAAWPAALRGTAVGSVLGILPGGGALLASFASYTFEKKITATPERFGHGAIEGVAAPESANNAAAQTSFIPLLTLGIPPNPIMAIMMGALIIQGIQPGASVMTVRPELFWALVASMWIGNLMLVIINLPMVGIWVKLLTVPYRLLYPAILLFCALGVYSTSTEPFMMVLLIVFTVFGYLLHKLGCEPAPLVLGFIVAPLMEENLRRSLVLSRGDPTIFLDRPISAVLLGISVIVLTLVIVPQFRNVREVAFHEQ